MFIPHCSKCFVELSKGKDLWVSLHCAHILCATCLGQSHRYCQVCKRFTNFQNLKNPNCHPRLPFFFYDRKELFKLVVTVLQFQENHTNLFIEHLNYENQKLARLEKATRKKAEYHRRYSLHGDIDSQQPFRSQSAKSVDEGFIDVTGSSKSQKSENASSINLGSNFDGLSETKLVPTRRASQPMRKRLPEDISSYTGRFERQSFSQRYKPYSELKNIGYNTAVLRGRPN